MTMCIFIGDSLTNILIKELVSANGKNGDLTSNVINANMPDSTTLLIIPTYSKCFILP